MLPVLLLLVSCDFQESEGHWHDQVHADGPCYRVDLFDGLSETSTDELHDLFDCLNQGNFEALESTVDALDEPTRTGDPAGLDLARLVNHLPSTGLDLAAMLDGVIILLDADGAPLLAAAELLVELAYGVPYDQILLDGPSTRAEDLQAGLVVPLFPLLGELATQALDDDEEMGDLAAQALRSELTLDAVATFLAVADAEEEPLSRVPDELLVQVGDALVAVQDDSNDRVPSATGNSLRDTADALLADVAGNTTPVELLLEPARVMLADEAVVDGLIDGLAEDSLGGHLDVLPSQLAWLATVDVDGDSLDPGEDSALVSLLRLLHTADREVSCSTLGWEWLHADNMSVWLLELIAEQEPDNVDFLLNIGGWTLSYGELVAALASQCTIDSAQFAADAPALERLVDPEVGDLLVVMLDLLQALQPEGGTSRIPELVEMVSLVHEHGLSEPVEALLEDLVTTQLIDLFLDLLPPLLDPWSERAWCANGTDSCVEETWAGYDEASFTGGRHPIDLYDLVQLVDLLAEPAHDGRTPLGRLRSTLQHVVASEASWTTLANAGTLLTTPGARSADILSDLPGWAEVDPDWKLLSTAADLLEDGACTTPTLRIVETEPVLDALETSTPAEEGPLPFLSRLVADGTLAEVLATVKLILDLLLEARS